MEKLMFDAIECRVDPEDVDIRFESIRDLLSRGADVNAKDVRGDTMLHKAILMENEKIVELLIDHGIDVNLRNKKGETAMLLAIKSFDSKTINIILKMLVEAGADANTATEFGAMALHVATKTGDVDLAQLLINRGADVNARTDTDHWTPLHWAASHTNSTNLIPMFEVLLSAGSDVNAEDISGETPLCVLLSSRPKLSSSLFAKLFKLFVEAGIDLDEKNGSGLKILHVAIYHNCTEAVEAFVTCGLVDVNSYFESPDYWIMKRQTILHVACDNLNFSAAKFLLKNGANINSLDSDNVSPLQRAINSLADRHEDETKLLRYLLKRNPNVNTITNDGKNILTPIRNDFSKRIFSWKLILRHLAKLETPIHQSLLDTISSDQDYKKYYELCKLEIEILKNSKVHPDFWITFLNLLVDDKRKLIQYAGNEALVQNFYECNVLKNFLIYGKEIRHKFTKAPEWRKIYDKASIKLSELLPIDVDPEHPVIQKIFSFLEFKEIRKIGL